MSDQELEAAMAANNADQQLRARLIHAEGEIIDSALDRVVTALRRWSGVEGSNANGQPPPPPIHHRTPLTLHCLYSQVQTGTKQLWPIQLQMDRVALEHWSS